MSSLFRTRRRLREFPKEMRAEFSQSSRSPGRCLSRVLAIFVLVGCASAQPASSRDVEAELLEITAQTIDAIKSGNRAFFEELLAADYIGTAVDGRVIDRGTFFSTFQPPPPSMKPEFETSEPRVRVHGTTAVLSIRRDFRGEVNGRPIAQSERTTQVFVRDGGRWRLLAEHSAPLAAANP